MHRIVNTILSLIRYVIFLPQSFSYASILLLTFTLLGIAKINMVPAQFGLISFLLLQEYLGMTFVYAFSKHIRAWFSDIEKHALVHQAAQVFGSKQRFGVVAAVALSITSAFSLLSLAASYPVATKHILLLMPYYFFCILTLLMVMKHYKSIKSSVLMVPALVRVIVMLLMMRIDEPFTAAILAFPLSIAVLMGVIQMVKRFPVTEQIEASAQKLFVFDSWPFAMLLSIDCIIASVMLSPADAGVYTASALIGRIPLVVGVALAWFLHAVNINQTRLQQVPLFFLSFLTSIGVGAGMFFFWKPLSVFFELSSINIWQVVPFLVGSSALLFIGSLPAITEMGGRNVYAFILKTSAILLSLLLFVFHHNPHMMANVHTGVVVGTSIIFYLICMVGSAAVRRNIVDLRLLTGAQDIPPVRAAVGTLRIVIVAKHDVHRSLSRMLPQVLNKWGRRGYHIVVLTQRNMAELPNEYRSNFTILRRGGKMTFHLWVLMYMYLRFRKKLDVLISTDGLLLSLGRMATNASTVILNMPKKRRKWGLSLSLSFVNVVLKITLLRLKNKPLITISRSKFSKLNIKPLAREGWGNA